MIVPGITASEAERCMSLVCAGREVDPDVHEIGVRDRSAWDRIRASFEEWLDDVASAFLEREGSQARFEFDAVAAEGLHRIFRLPGFAIASADFWRYVNVVLLRDCLLWRHGSAQEDGSLRVAKVNYGCGAARDDLASRLWFRGELGYAPDRSDPYELVRRGGTDFWTSGVTRVLYPSARTITRALIELRYPEPGMFKGNEYQPQTLNTDRSRELYKRLRHYDAILNYASFDAEQAREFVHSIASDLLA